MSTCLPVSENVVLVDSATGPLFVARGREYLEIIKPRISLMVLVAVAAGYLLGVREEINLSVMLAAVFGVGLVAGSSTAFNQWYERDTDSLMARTENRAIPAGRVPATEVLWLSVLLGVLGLSVLAWKTSGTVVLAALATMAAYSFIYTPSKRWTSLCTAIGAVPGAMPMALGWLAAGQEWDATAWGLFGLMYLWQFPHFLAIAWKYREQYAFAGLKMLPQRSSVRGVTGRVAVAYALVLIPVSLLPTWSGAAGTPYFITAFVFGLAYLEASRRFAADESNETARGVVLTSLVYLPILMSVLVFDHWRGLQGF